MIINNNMSAEYSQRVFSQRNNMLQNNVQKLSTGNRIANAKDDAPGLAISERLRSQVRGLNQASSNIQDAVSFLQSSEGYLQETNTVLQRMRELAIQASNGFFSSGSREAIQAEVNQLVDEIDRVAAQSDFNGLNILTGRFATGSGNLMQFQVGANVDQRLSIGIENMSSQALGLTGDGDGGQQTLSMDNIDNANRAIAVVDNALNQVIKQRTEISALQSRLGFLSDNTKLAAENMQAAESKIRDLDFAKEMVNFVRNQILMQANSAILAQANVMQQAVLGLIQ